MSNLKKNSPTKPIAVHAGSSNRIEKFTGKEPYSPSTGANAGFEVQTKTLFSSQRYTCVHRG